MIQLQRPRRHALVALLVTALAASGCSVGPLMARTRTMLGLGFSGSTGFTVEDLRNSLLGYAARFNATIIATADQISAGSDDSEVKRRALLWKVRITPVVDQAISAVDAELSFVALFTLAVAQADFLETGTGKDLFDDQQDDAVSAAKTLVEVGRAIARRFLSPADQQRLEEQVSALARERPLRGVFVPETVQAVVSATVPGGSFDWIINYPLAPFRALEGVDSGAQAIREFNATAERFNQILQDMPQRLRWNAELFGFEIEQKPALESARASLEELAHSSDTFSHAVASLPRELREQAGALVSQLDASQGQLQRTLVEARGLMADANGTSEQLAPLAAALERTASEAQQAGATWAALVAEVRKPEPPDASGEKRRAFDIADYERTAAQVTKAAGELRGMLSDLRELDPLLERVEGGGRSLVDLAAWRVLELMLAFFGLLFAYRRIETRLAARRSGDGGSEGSPPG